MAEKCYGNIDSVNGTSPVPKLFSTTNILNTEGWLATSVSEGLVPDSVLVVLRDENGTNTFIQAQRKAHVWAGNRFKKPAMAMSGYTTTADVSRISGSCSLGLA